MGVMRQKVPNYYHLRPDKKGHYATHSSFPEAVIACCMSVHVVDSMQGLSYTNITAATPSRQSPVSAKVAAPVVRQA